MTSPMLQPALQFHNEGLNIIPCIPGDKMPDPQAFPPKGEWLEYHSRYSTLEEVKHWWGNGYHKDFNIGVVHMDGYTTLDIDEDNGVTDLLFDNFLHLCQGRIEQSGSGQGYHIPIRVDSLPDWGLDNKGRPVGNKTWKVIQNSIYLGKINIRAQRCQTILPPSIHPSGGLYRYMQNGPITHIQNYNPLVDWLNSICPVAPKQSREYTKQAIKPTQGDDLLSAVKAAWPTCLSVFAHFGMAGNVQQERNNELRLLGNGGLLLTDDGEKWFDFEGERGGGLFEAWWFCRFGTPYDKHNHFRQVLIEMAEAAGIDSAKFYRKGDEAKVTVQSGSTKLWAGVYGQVWSKMR